MIEYSCDAATDAGMWALWDPNHFAQIIDYDSWEDMLLEDDDIRQHVKEGKFVPIYIRSDGCFGFCIRIAERGGASLTCREQSFLVVSSENYLFVSEGEIYFSGIEHVGMPIDDGVVRISLPAGRYEATIHMLDWKAEAGSQSEDGRPTANALPDFLIIIKPEKMFRAPYRMEVLTFDPI